jgi:hypothetical protein
MIVDSFIYLFVSRGVIVRLRIVLSFLPYIFVDT